MGSRGKPFYRLVVADQRVANSGKAIEQLGWYNPLTEPSSFDINSERAKFWLKNGARPTEAVERLFKKKGIVAEV